MIHRSYDQRCDKKKPAQIMANEGKGYYEIEAYLKNEIRGSNLVIICSWTKEKKKRATTTLYEPGLWFRMRDREREREREYVCVCVCVCVCLCVCVVCVCVLKIYV